MQGVVLGSHFHCQLQSAYVSFLAVVVYTIIIGATLLVKLVGIALIVLVPNTTILISVVALGSILCNKACVVSRRRTVIGFGAYWISGLAEIR